MPRYVAFLRGVSPMNAKMPELKRAFEQAGFEDVETALSSGNVIFSSALRSPAKIEQTAEATMQKHLGKAFYTIVRSVEDLQQMLEADPFVAFKLPKDGKRVVTFFRETRKPAKPLPVELDEACILATTGREAFSVYVPGPKGPVFMTLIEKIFGKNVTTRTWETVTKCSKL